MSQSYVLDTSVLLNLIRGRELGQQIERKFGLKAALHRHTISIVTHGELHALAARNNWNQSKKDVLASALTQLVTVNIDNMSIIDAYIQVETACRNNTEGERRMGHNDMWIAATALFTGLPLITTDRDFDHLNGNLIQVCWVDPELGKPKTL